MSATRRLTDPWRLGDLRISNRVVLAPLAGIGNWFVRLQAKRYGAGLAFSEMVSSHAVHYRNEKTCTELLRIHPAERAGGPVAIQLFGQDPDIMRSAAATVAAAGADIIDLNMGCPVPKVCKTGAGAALIGDPDVAVAVATAAREGSGLPVTVKLRCGRRRGETDGVELAQRLVAEAGVAAICFHPRSAQVQHKGEPDLELATELARSLPVPVILSGGMRDPAWIADAFERTGATAVMLARGALGDPWLFARLLDAGAEEPTREQVLDELGWVLARAEEHLGEERAARYLRKFYPWYVDRLGSGSRPERRAAADRLARRGAGRSRAPARPGRSRRLSPHGTPGGGCYTGAPPTAVGRFRSMPKDVILTPEGLEKLKLELEDLQTNKRREVAERIKEARAFGDISENSEYDDAKNEQAMLEQRIASVEEKLRSATVIDAKDLTTDVVQVGSVVKVADEGTGKDQTFTIVGSAEAKPPERLSNESPVGRALIGRRRDDVVEVPLPRGGARKLRITAIEVGL